MNKNIRPLNERTSRAFNSFVPQTASWVLFFFLWGTQAGLPQMRISVPQQYHGAVTVPIPVDPPWTQELIKKEDRNHDFKTVARGARTEHSFVLKNRFEETVHIAGITTSCTCTDASVQDNKTELQTYEEAKIVARLRTDLYEGLRNATITVTIDKPYDAVIQLNIRGEIRSDISVVPNGVRFENVKVGEEISRTIDVTYTGKNPSWKILDFKSVNEHLSAEIEEVRTRPGSLVTKIRITQDGEAPRGQYSDSIVFLTNDAGNRREIPILVQGTVGTTINVSPSTVFLGHLKAGEPSPQKLAILRGTQPFRIKKLTCSNPAVEILYIPKETDLARTLYRIPVKYNNPAQGDGAPENGKLRATVNVETDQPELSPVFNVTMETATE